MKHAMKKLTPSRFFLKNIVACPISRQTRLIFFAINFSSALALMVLCVLDFAFAQHYPQGLLLFVLGPMFTIFGIIEWLGWYHKLPSAEAFNGVICLMLSWLAVFAIISTSVETWNDLAAGDLFMLYAIMWVIASYGSLCGLRRLLQPWWAREKTACDQRS